MSGADRVRWWFTDRYGMGGDVADEQARSSQSTYGDFNLATHVGDDPVVVERHRRRLWPTPVAFMEQVHGPQVAVLDGHPGGPVPATDALVTTVPNLPLAVCVADCLPVLMYQPKVEVIGAVHAGRAGIVGGVLAAALEAIESCGGSASQVMVRIGPSIGPCCYEVPAEMADAVAADLPEASGTTRWGTPALDLRAAAVAQLRAAGVTQIAVSDVCTFSSPRHYSYRRDGVTGRFAGIIVLPDQALPAPRSAEVD